MKKSDFEFLLQILKDNAGWNFSEENYYILDKKISNYLREKNYVSSEELIDELRLGSKPLIAQIIEYLSMSDTYFFRDYSVFTHFENTVLPYLKEANRATKKLRMWSLGCSSGQETYSIAMAVKNKFLGLGEWNIDILGTDLSGVAITKAQRGIYNNFEIQMGLPARMIIDNFDYENDAWQIKDDVYRMVEFRKYNLLDDITFSEKYEVIFCRNVLRFFTPEYQKMLIEKIFNTQTRNGFLYLGMNEQVAGIEKFYKKVPNFSCLYQAVDFQKPETPKASLPGGAASEKAMPSFVKPQGLSGAHPLMSEVIGSKE